MGLLAERERRGLHCALPWGRPFREQLAEARRLGIPPVAVNTAAYRTEEERRLLILLRSIGRIIPIDRLPATEIPHSSLRFAPQETLRSFYSAVPDAVSNAAAFAEAGVFHPFSGTCVFPSFRGNSEEDSFRILKRLCVAGIERRYGAGRADSRRAVLDRLSRELSVIRAKGFAGYFLVVHDIVSRCPRTCGRGSSASSIVSYLLGITHVDHWRRPLLRTFPQQGPRRSPDIDIDFPWDERRKALDYVFFAYPGSAGYGC
jgi:error-prone DNA polymerase